MRLFFSFSMWSFTLAALLVVCARFLHPATFAESVFPLLVGCAAVSAALYMAGKRYE